MQPQKGQRAQPLQVVGGDVALWGCAPPNWLCDPGLILQVLRNKGVYESVKYIQQENFWIGPSSVSDLPA